VLQFNGRTTTILTLRIRTKIRPVQANSHFPHPLPCHICVHLAPGQLELHDFEKQQGCYLPARSNLRKHGKATENGTDIIKSIVNIQLT
jgi:hypothetical protein